MTDHPKAVAFYPPEWQAVCIGSAEQLAAFFRSGAVINAEQVKAVSDHLDRLRTFVGAWKASVPAQMAEPAKVEEPKATAPVTNGAAPKRKGGWPKGKPRKRMNPMNVGMAQ